MTMMNPPEILQALAFFDGTFPRQALKAAIAQKDAITPLLLEELEGLRGKFRDVDDDYFLYIYCFFLLAQFRETKAYPLIVDLMIEAGDEADNLLGEFITEDLPRVLASVYDGELGPLFRLIETDGDEFVRGAGFQTLSILYLYEKISRQELLQAFETYLRRCLEAPTTFPIATGIILESISIHSTELKDLIDQVFDADLIDETFVSREEVEQEFTNRTLKQALQELRELKHYKLVDDVIKEIEWWHCFQENRGEIEKSMLAELERLLVRKKFSPNLEAMSALPENDYAPKRANPNKKAKQKQQKQSRKKNRPKKK
jgi:hypothetical protein